jgi:acetyl-CoA acetyltransferase
MRFAGRRTGRKRGPQCGARGWLAVRNIGSFAQPFADWDYKQFIWRHRCRLWALDLVIAGRRKRALFAYRLSERADLDLGIHDWPRLNLRERLFQIPQGISADLIATLEGFTREDLDAIALRSQQNAARAIRECRFSKSLFPVRDPFTRQVVLDRDEFPRPDTTAEGLAALNPAFINLGQSVEAEW